MTLIPLMNLVKKNALSTCCTCYVSIHTKGNILKLSLSNCGITDLNVER